MKTIESVTALVNCLFHAYNQSIQGLDWEEKITEYAEVINEFIGIETDLNDLYMQIRQNFSNLPQPSAIKKMLSKNHKKSEIKEYTEHPDNGKQIAITCYRGGIPREVRVFVISNVPDKNSKTQSEITQNLREKYNDIKIYEFSKATTIYRSCKKLEDGTIQATAEAWIPQGYNEKGEITGYDKRKIA